LAEGILTISRLIPFLTIEKVALHGYGIGFADGKAVFVPFTMPGDCVHVKVRIEKKDVIFGSVDEYISSADDSILPQCDAFGGENACGGCDWLMAPYDLQTRWKTELLRQVFEPLRLQNKVKAIVPSPQPQHYRNKSFLPAGTGRDGLYFGMYARYSHDMISHKRCLLQPSVMDEILEEVTAFAAKTGLESYDEITHSGILRHLGIRINRAQDQVMLIPVTKGSKFPFTKQFVRIMTDAFPQISGIVQNINRSVGNVILRNDDKHLSGSPYLDDEMDGVRFRLHYKTFYQINSASALLMYKHIKDNLDADDTLLDAFCGAGTIGLFIADKVKSILGIEEVPEAVADAEYNRTLNGIANARFLTGKVEDILPSLMKAEKFTAIILDPPRKGVDTASLAALAAAGIPKIIYASCNPMTLARDLAFLQDKGYNVMDITPFDMFPQTWHIESVAQLQLR
jgi:23S rRNA (uracil1939-C5)-methyltransferase